MTRQAKILTLMLALASPVAIACNPAEGSGQCGYLGADGIYNSRIDADESYQRLYYNNTYIEPEPVYRPPPPPPTHHCTAREEGGELCADTRPGRIGSSYSTNAAGDFDGPMAESYSDGTLKSITNYHNGEIHGTVRNYRQNGTLEYEITFCNGETCGEQYNYDEQGNIVKITRFDANGDVESVEEVSPGRKPRKKS